MYKYMTPYLKKENKWLMFTFYKDHNHVGRKEVIDLSNDALRTFYLC